MSPTHYADLKPGEQSSRRFGTHALLGVVMARIHAFNAGRPPESRVALFPTGLPSAEGEPGDGAVRLFGSQDNLENFLDDLVVQGLSANGHVIRPRVRQVPTGNHLMVAWMRTRLGDRMTVPYHERRQRRETERFLAKGGEGRQPADSVARLQRVSPSAGAENHYVNVRSASTGSDFRMRMCAAEVSDVQADAVGEIGTYGLSSLKKPYGLPSFD